jgi:hypothetical protein
MKSVILKASASAIWCYKGGNNTYWRVAGGGQRKGKWEVGEKRGVLTFTLAAGCVEVSRKLLQSAVY